MNAIAVERLPGLLGHELRNPLASAVTGAMLARDMIDDGDPRAAVLDGVLRDLDRMTGLVDGWLALARGAVTQKRRFAARELLQAIAARHGAQIVVCPDDVFVDGNRALLERALDNLCENAKQAGARTIRLGAQRLGDELSVHVEDDGRGVPVENVERIFAAGFSSRGSAGLGLYGVAATVAAHRGTVRCVPLGKGTRFTVTLPCALARTASA